MTRRRYDTRQPTEDEMLRFRCKFMVLYSLAHHALQNGNEGVNMEHYMGQDIAEAIWALGRELTDICGVEWSEPHPDLVKMAEEGGAE